MSDFDILYTINKNYIDIFLVSFYSILKNSKLEKIRLHLVTCDFECDDYKRIEQFISLYHDVEIYFYPLEEYDIKKYHLPNWRGTQIANARLFFQNILKDNLKGVRSLLYLDSDTITVGGAPVRCNVYSRWDSDLVIPSKELVVSLGTEVVR